MCFHSQLKTDAETLSKRFKVQMPHAGQPTMKGIFNGFAHPYTPIITRAMSTQITSARWGLIPNWADIKTYNANTLNAQIETLNERPSFSPYTENRCLILADGFYEWQWLDGKGKRKQKYLITRPQNEPYAYAGIYTVIDNLEAGTSLVTYTILTTKANELMAEIHNTKKRMPIILSHESEKSWLSGEPIGSFIDHDIDLVATPFD